MTERAIVTDRHGDTLTLDRAKNLDPHKLFITCEEDEDCATIELDRKSATALIDALEKWVIKGEL